MLGRILLYLMLTAFLTPMWPIACVRGTYNMQLFHELFGGGLLVACACMFVVFVLSIYAAVAKHPVASTVGFKWLLGISGGTFMLGVLVFGR
ncbi:MAG: hypothetical protein U0640_11470 [Phycisphaerales bacterium]